MQKQIILSQRDWEKFIQVVDDDTPPSPKLQKTMNKYMEGILSLGTAAKVAEMPYALFMEHLSHTGIPVVDYQSDELEDERRVVSR